MAHWSPCVGTASPLTLAPVVVSLADVDVHSAESSRSIAAAATQQPAEIGFEFESVPLEISPQLAKVLLRILRKAADRRSIEIDGTVSPPS